MGGWLVCSVLALPSSPRCSSSSSSSSSPPPRSRRGRVVCIEKQHGTTTTSGEGLIQRIVWGEQDEDSSFSLAAMVGDDSGWWWEWHLERRVFAYQKYTHQEHGVLLPVVLTNEEQNRADRVVCLCLNHKSNADAPLLEEEATTCLAPSMARRFGGLQLSEGEGSSWR